MNNKKMNNKKNVIDNIYSQLSDWFESFEQNEVTNVVEIVEQAKQYLKAAEQLPDFNVKQFSENLENDLNQFYQQYQSDVKHSIFLDLIKESVWQALSKITDTAQVQWAELSTELKDGGEYKEGDIIGFGVLKCKQCGETLSIYHAGVVPCCAQCGGKIFQRESLES